MSFINKSGFKKVALVTKLKQIIMTRGLFKSVTLHFGILFVFLYGAEIFKQNKRFEIYEIPLEIVDVSDETVNKTDKVKKQNKKSLSKNQFFLPPKPKSKPTPPEFALK